MSTNKYLECTCSSTEHVIKIVSEVDAEHPKLSSITIEVQLSKYAPWHQRVWKAVKYVFGYECKYGHWDVTILNVEEVNKLHMLLHDFNKDLADVISKSEE